MQPFDPLQHVEQFHLLFLSMLGRKIDGRHCILKGGCNLRFFLKSVRYSEDMDFDVWKIESHKLRDAVGGILASRPFADILQARRLGIERWSAPKQTETTQRWKMGLRTPDSPVALPTKIEFSRRGPGEGARFEPVDPALIRAYGLPPVMASHYGAEAAFAQKVEALVSRRETQARDVFDLNLLLDSGVSPPPEDPASAGRFEEAQAKALSIGFDVFKGQVLSFLAPEVRSQYDSKAVWDGIVLKVAQALAGGRKP